MKTGQWDFFEIILWIGSRSPQMIADFQSLREGHQHNNYRPHSGGEMFVIHSYLDGAVVGYGDAIDELRVALQDNALCASSLGPDGTRAMRAAYEFSDWSISYETSGTYVTRDLYDVRASANDVIVHWPQSCSDLTRYADSSGGPGRKSVKHIVAGEIWDSRRSRKLPLCPTLREEAVACLADFDALDGVRGLARPAKSNTVEGWLRDQYNAAKTAGDKL
ncbi:hypothetical protein [Sphingopyxis sp.]|uniref:hypothetical protein n=1 Tax=Sphingopyxis sp. TaxID=1908224 RepID=UPI003D6CC25E